MSFEVIAKIVNIKVSNHNSSYKLFMSIRQFRKKLKIRHTQIIREFAIFTKLSNCPELPVFRLAQKIHKKILHLRS
jgi:hypothetical protein